jgi:hypothetical protein
MMFPQDAQRSSGVKTKRSKRLVTKRIVLPRRIEHTTFVKFAPAR